MNKVLLTPAKCALDMGDGSERGLYVNQDYILQKMKKVHRICEALTTTAAYAYGTPSLSFDRTQYDIEAFGDSRGDKEMLAFADKGHYKPFRI